MSAIQPAPEREQELGRAAALVSEIIDGRTAGNHDTLAGNADDDLLGAVEELESAIADWRAGGGGA